MKLRKFSKQILSIVLAVFMVVGMFYGVDFLPELKADALTENDAITDLHHDQASYFMSNIQPAAGESVTIRMRAVKGNVNSAKLIYYNLDTKKSTDSIPGRTPCFSPAPPDSHQQALSPSTSCAQNVTSLPAGAPPSLCG